eukprot:239539-Amphidinium_carterae.10
MQTQRRLGNGTETTHVSKGHCFLNSSTATTTIALRAVCSNWHFQTQVALAVLSGAYSVTAVAPPFYT